MRFYSQSLVRGLYVAFLCSILTLKLQAQSSPEPVVDQRVETVSIIFRLAEGTGYTMKQLNRYVEDIEKHFGPYKNHAAVQFARKLVRTRGMGYNGPMDLAVHLSAPPEFKPVVTFTKQIPEERWGKSNADKFIVLLRDFYRDAKCEEFFSAHREYYERAQKNFKASMGTVDVSWFEKFYGEKPKGIFNLIIGLGNGGANYGSKVVFPDGREDLYPIISNALPDSLGFATFKPEHIQSTIIHEYNHSFVNYLVYARASEFTPEVKSVFSAVSKPMKNMAYSRWEIMVNESLVREGEIQYAKMHGASDKGIINRIRDEQGRGWVWMDKLHDLLEKYNANRQTYPTFKSFIPEVIKFYKSLGDVNQLVADFEKMRPQVVRIEPISSNAEIDSNLTEMIIYFDRPMGKGISIGLGKKGIDHFPLLREKDAVKWSEDGKSLQLKTALKPGWDYEFTLLPWSLRSTEGYMISQKEYSFRTRE
ncbi:DUF4932 domain-containing protein [Cytophagales bacterium WSM2-2]|nr:DUF4932 domain-containing protein [Cytophagales bacterium WSM2-2]